jgi:hypothetical protein
MELDRHLIEIVALRPGRRALTTAADDGWYRLLNRLNLVAFESKICFGAVTSLGSFATVAAGLQQYWRRKASAVSIQAKAAIIGSAVIRFPRAFYPGRDGSYYRARIIIRSPVHYHEAQQT